MPLLSLTLLITLPLSRPPCFSHQVPISMFSSHLLLLWMCMCMSFMLCCVFGGGEFWDLLSLSRPSGKDMNVKVFTESWVTYHCRWPLSRQPLTSVHFPEYRVEPPFHLDWVLTFSVLYRPYTCSHDSFTCRLSHSRALRYFLLPHLRVTLILKKPTVRITYENINCKARIFLSDTSGL